MKNGLAGFIINKMIGKITFATAVLATAAYAEQELEIDELREMREVQEIIDLEPADDIEPYRPAYPWWKYRQSYCRMRYNPAYPTSYPWGIFWLREYGPWSPLYIWGKMWQMPAPASKHGFSINTKPFDFKDCKSTEPHWNPYSQVHGAMNSWPSHAGDLNPVIDNGFGQASYFAQAW